MTESSWHPPQSGPPSQPNPPQPQSSYPQQSFDPRMGQQPSQAGRRRRLPLVLAAVAGLVLGGGGMGLTWWLTSGSEDGAAAYAAGACDIVDAFEPSPSSEPGYLDNYRLTAAYALAKTAGEEDPAFSTLSEKADDLIIFAQRLEFDSPEAREVIAEVRAACDDL